MLPLLGDFQSANLGSELNEINYFNQFIASSNNHSNDDEFVDVRDHNFPGASTNFLDSQEYFTLDPESDSVKEGVLIEDSSLSHYPLCSTFCDASTCDGSTPSSSST